MHSIIFSPKFDKYNFIKVVGLSVLFVLGTSSYSFGQGPHLDPDERGEPPRPTSRSFSITYPDNAPGSLQWSSAGPIRGQVCTQINEPGEPREHTWADNYLCVPVDIGLRFSYAGRIPGLKCISMNEPADKHAWGDNYLCMPPSLPIDFHWRVAGPIANEKCVQIKESADPNTWSDNYLCYPLDSRFFASNSSGVLQASLGSFEIAANGEYNWGKVALVTLAGAAAGAEAGRIIGGVVGPIGAFYGAIGGLAIGAGAGAAGEMRDQENNFINIPRQENGGGVDHGGREPPARGEVTPGGAGVEINGHPQ